VNHACLGGANRYDCGADHPVYDLRCAGR
jgi:hypothetical protein